MWYLQDITKRRVSGTEKLTSVSIILVDFEIFWYNTHAVADADLTWLLFFSFQWSQPGNISCSSWVYLRQQWRSCTRSTAGHQSSELQRQHSRQWHRYPSFGIVHHLLKRSSGWRDRWDELQCCRQPTCLGHRMGCDGGNFRDIVYLNKCFVSIFNEEQNGLSVLSNRMV